MKRYLCAVLAAALLAPGLMTVAARAQDDEGGPEAAEPHEGRGGVDHAKMQEHLKKHLELTDDQAAKLKDAMKAHHDAMKPLWDKVRADTRKLGEQVKAKASDSDVQASLDALKADHKAVAEADQKFHESLSFLTPTQQAKMLLGMMRMRREHMKGPMREPKGRGKDKDNGGDDDKDGD
jgi:Spy/CpxP family protein refolding chaperone